MNLFRTGILMALLTGLRHPERLGLEWRAIEALRHRPEKPVAIIQILAPLAVAEQIGARDLDLDDGDHAAGIDRHHVGAAAVGQRHLADAEQIEVEEQPRDAPRHVLRGEGSVGEAESRFETRGGSHSPN